MSTDHMAAASSDFDIFNLFDTDDIELSQLCEKMDTENNLINTADIFYIFNLFDTDGGLKDLELKNKKITHYCQEDIFCITFTYYKKGALAHPLKEQKTFENIHTYCNYVYPSPHFQRQTYMYCFCSVCPSVTVTNFVSTVSSVPLYGLLIKNLV